MGRYYVRKLMSFALALLIVSAATFPALNDLPGDPALLIAGTEGDEQLLASLREQLQLDRPASHRYADWMLGMLAGDFGRSIRYSIPVSRLVADALPVTLQLAVMSILLAAVVAVPLGITCAMYHHSIYDRLVLVISQFGMALPPFAIGLLLIYVGAVQLRWFPAGGYQSFLSLILPGLALSLPRMAVLTRMVRTSMIEIMEQDYIRTARSKGLGSLAVYGLHGFKNASIGVFTVAGIQLTQLLAGTIVIEQVFSLPGMGRLMLAAVLSRDLVLVQGLVVVGAALILLANFAFDIILTYLDPRIQWKGESQWDTD